MIRSFAVLLAVAMTAGVAADAAAQERTRDGWRSDLIGQWLDAVERHSPGEIDSPLIGAARWSSTDLHTLWADVQVLLDIVDNPKHNKFTVAPLDYERRGQRGAPPTVTFRASERAILDALAGRVRAAGVNAVLRRAAILHTDVATLAPGLEQPPVSRSANAPIRLLVGDGNSAGTKDISLQWELARMILSNGSAEPAFDAFVRDWYRATVALAHSVQSFDSVQLREGLRLFPNDPVLLLLAGCEREAFATPLFQVFAQSFRNARMRPDIASEDTELDAAAGFFRRALAADEGLGEARVRLGRVLSLKQRYADSARELRRALDGRLDRVLQYYAELFLGAALEGLGEAAAARDAFRRAADGTPGARAAHLAVARIAREMGDREETTARLEQAMSMPGNTTPIESLVGVSLGARQTERRLARRCAAGSEGRGSMTGAKWMTSAVALLMATAAAAAQQPTFSSRIEGVRIDALVSEAGAPIAGLAPGDFEVRDNGVRQEIDLVSLADVPVNVVLTLDLSASVAGAKLAGLVGASRSLLDGLAPEDSAALITFNHAVVQRVPLTRRIDAIREALDEPEADGDTALVDASLGAMLLGDTDAGRTLVVVFSDGVDTASFVRPELVLDTARRVNGIVYGVSSSAGETRFLRELTAATGGRIIGIGETGDPGPAFLEVLREFRRRYVITFTPTGVTPGGWHKLEVRVNRPRARVQARAGYFSSAR